MNLVIRSVSDSLSINLFFVPLYSYVSQQVIFVVLVYDRGWAPLAKTLVQAMTGASEVVNDLAKLSVPVDQHMRPSALVQAIEANDGKGVARLLRDPRYRLAASLLAPVGPKGATPVHLAAAKGREAALESLLRFGGRVVDRAIDDDGETPLHVAVHAGNAASIRVMLAAPGGPEAGRKACQRGKTPGLLAMDLYKSAVAKRSPSVHSDEGESLWQCCSLLLPILSREDQHSTRASKSTTSAAHKSPSPSKSRLGQQRRPILPPSPKKLPKAKLAKSVQVSPIIKSSVEVKPQIKREPTLISFGQNSDGDDRFMACPSLLDREKEEKKDKQQQEQQQQQQKPNSLALNEEVLYIEVFELSD